MQDRRALGVSCHSHLLSVGIEHVEADPQSLDTSMNKLLHSTIWTSQPARIIGGIFNYKLDSQIAFVKSQTHKVHRLPPLQVLLPEEICASSETNAMSYTLCFNFVKARLIIQQEALHSAGFKTTTTKIQPKKTTWDISVQLFPSQL